MQTPSSYSYRTQVLLLVLGVLAVGFFGSPESGNATTWARYHHAGCGSMSLQTGDQSSVFWGYVDGVDGGGIDVYYGETLTVLNGQTVVWSPGYSLGIYGTIVILGTGQLKQTYIWIQDGDGDGYSCSGCAYYAYAGDSYPGGSYVRRCNLSHWMEEDDCDDTWYEQPWCDPG